MSSDLEPSFKMALVTLLQLKKLGWGGCQRQYVMKPLLIFKNKIIFTKQKFLKYIFKDDPVHRKHTFANIRKRTGDN